MYSALYPKQNRDMENRAKLRFPRTLLSPFSSCKAHKLISDVIHHHQTRRRQNHQRQEQIIPYSSTSMDPLLPTSSPYSFRRPTPVPYPSMCKPRCHKTFGEMIRESCIVPMDRHKIAGNYELIHGEEEMTCPPTSPVSPLKHHQKQRMKEKRKKKMKQKTNFSSSEKEWFSSDDEREEEDDTLFSSSRSFISLSSSKSSDLESFGLSRIQTRRKPPSARRREARKKRSMEEKVKGSYAVVKRSKDPYSDFRDSMAEMILEKRLIGARELEQLLECFLSLNSPHYHRVIIEAFGEICDALFFNRVGL